MKYVIYHNNRCRKSREALHFLEEQKLPHSVVHYLEQPLNKKELEKLLEDLSLTPTELIRKNEAIWKTEYKGKTLSDPELIEAMINYPKLIERPIISFNGKAIIARPVERLHEFVK